MMLLAEGLLLGGFFGLLISLWETRLVKLLNEEIEQEKKWPIWVLPVINGILGMAACKISGSYLDIFFNVIFISLLVLLTCFDYKYMLLPTRVIVPGGVLAFCYQLLCYLRTGNRVLLINALLGGIVGFALFWLIFYGCQLILKKEGLGYGDVRLMAFIGLLLGFDQLFLLIIMASLLAVLAGVVLFIIRKHSEAFPFGPFLCLGTLIMLIFGNDILSFYMHCLGI